MTEKVNEAHLKLAYQLVKDMQEDNFEYSYRGIFTKTITNKILSLAETKLENSDDTKKIRKRIYFILVECLQNITKHQDKDTSGNPLDPGLFTLQKKKGRYYITTGNIIENENVEKLKGQLEKVNSLDKDELKAFYTEMMITGQISDKGGAGLGLIAMARKSGNKLLYDFRKHNDNKTYFYLRTEIPLEKVETLENGNGTRSLVHTKELHELLDQQNIILNFNGSFDQENFINLLSIVSGQMMGEAGLKEKVYYVMVEMLQNIVYYADRFLEDMKNTTNNSPGIFFLKQNDNSYHLTAGNYIINDKVDVLKEKIAYVNSLNQEEIFKYYQETLEIYKKDPPLKPDLSIIEMRLKSENHLYCNFHKVNETLSFFTVQTVVD
jgi:uncharacterized protein DUF6272